MQLMTIWKKTMRELPKISIADSTFSNAGKMAVLCPFHQEKTPSMVIDFNDKTYHCLGCGRKGRIRGVIIFGEGINDLNPLERW